MVFLDYHKRVIFKRFSRDMQDFKTSDIPVAKEDKFSLNQCHNHNFKENEMQKISYTQQ